MDGCGKEFLLHEPALFFHPLHFSSFIYSYLFLLFAPSIHFITRHASLHWNVLPYFHFYLALLAHNVNIIPFICFLILFIIYLY